MRSTAKKKPKAKPAKKAAVRVKAASKRTDRSTRPSRSKPKGRATMTDKDKDTKPEPKPVPKEIPAGGTQGAYSATTVGVPPEDMMTEQEKLAAAGAVGDETAGVGPVSPSEHTTGPVETIEDQGIGPRTPYPEGNPPPPDVVVTRSEGINKPGEPAKRKPNT